MANLALVTAGKLNPVSGVANGHEQYTFEAEEQISVGQVFRISTTTGKATKANGTTLAESGQAAGPVRNSQLYIAIDQARQAGNAVTGMKKGLVDGFNLDAQAYGAQIFVSDTDGALGDAAGTVSVAAGRVVPAPLSGTPSVQDKLLYIDFPS